MSELENPTPPESGRSLATPILFGISIALLIAVVYLFFQVSGLQSEVANFRKATTKEISSMREASSVSVASSRRTIEALKEDLEATQRRASMAVGQAKTEMMDRAKALNDQIREEQRRMAAHTASQIAEVREDATTKIGAVATDVTGVKTDLTATKTELEKTISDLKRVRGDMGEMSGLIATNGKELGALKALGDRNYFEFDLKKTKAPQRIGDIAVLLKKADTRKNQYTIEVVADDKRFERKDKSINEPVQFYTAKARQPYEFVVNRVGRDQIVGYLATPKVTSGR
jgi:predicted  nucleic acid-binding Zn-ribbon protein